MSRPSKPSAGTPFSLSSFKAPRRSQARPAVFIPKGQQFRLHPEYDHSVTNVFIKLHDDRWHLVDAEIATSASYLPGVWVADLYEGILATGESFLLPVTHPVGQGYESWYESLTNIIPFAKESWTTLETVSAEQQYRAKVRKKEKTIPDWPDTDFELLVEHAFRGRIIDHNHPLTGSGNPSRSKCTSVVEEFD